MVQVRSIMSSPRRADLRHVVEHDRVAALGHDRQVGARLVRPHAEAEEAEAELFAHRLGLGEMAARFRAGLVEMLALRAGKLELAGGLKADRAVGAGQRDDVAVLDDRLPAELGQFGEQVANAARLVIGGRAMIAAAEDELLVLGADRPVLLRLLALREGREQIVAALDRALLGRFGAGRHRASSASSCPPARLVAPVPGRRHPKRDRRQRRRVGAQDAGAERDRAGLGDGADRRRAPRR